MTHVSLLSLLDKVIEFEESDCDDSWMTEELLEEAFAEIVQERDNFIAVHTNTVKQLEDSEAELRGLKLLIKGNYQILENLMMKVHDGVIDPTQVPVQFEQIYHFQSHEKYRTRYVALKTKITRLQKILDHMGDK